VPRLIGSGVHVDLQQANVRVAEVVSHPDRWILTQAGVFLGRLGASQNAAGVPLPQPFARRRQYSGGRVDWRDWCHPSSVPLPRHGRRA